MAALMQVEQSPLISEFGALLILASAVCRRT